MSYFNEGVVAKFPIDEVLGSFEVIDDRIHVRFPAIDILGDLTEQPKEVIDKLERQALATPKLKEREADTLTAFFHEARERR